MLSLKSTTGQRWLDQVDADLPSILIDHAHCEKKAAGTAMGLIVAYVEQDALRREMAFIVNEELEHFQLVLDLIERRGIHFARIKPSSYGKRLHALVRTVEPMRGMDRLIVAGLIEARSCERFQRLHEHVRDRELADFYGSLFEAEARHHATYIRLAQAYGSEEDVRSRIDELSLAEAAIIDQGDPFPRMHS